MQPDRLRLEPPERVRRPRTSWIALGLLVTIGFGLLGAITVARVADREALLALAAPIERGQTLTASHLTVVNVGVDDGTVPLIPAGERDRLIGRAAVAPLESGALLQESQFIDGPSVPAGSSVVGLALAPGQYPTAELRPGDHVMIVRTPPNAPSADGDAAATVLVNDAEVFAVETLSETARTVMLSVTVPVEAVPEISAAAAADGIRVALVGGP